MQGVQSALRFNSGVHYNCDSQSSKNVNCVNDSNTTGLQIFLYEMRVTRERPYRLMKVLTAPHMTAVLELKSISGKLSAFTRLHTGKYLFIERNWFSYHVMHPLRYYFRENWQYVMDSLACHVRCQRHDRWNLQPETETRCTWCSSNTRFQRRQCHVHNRLTFYINRRLLL